MKLDKVEDKGSGLDIGQSEIISLSKFIDTALSNVKT